MTAMEIQQRKKNFIRNYLDEIDSLEMMEKLEKCTKRILNKKATVCPLLLLVSKKPTKRLTWQNKN
mgnify:CR=1 FL=1